MRKVLLSAVAAASLFAIPAFAADGLSSDPEIRVQQEWQLLVAKTNGVSPVTIESAHTAAAPASSTLSSDSEIRAQQEFEQLVAKANAFHAQSGNIAANR